jgi:hypothetical protein
MLSRMTFADSVLARLVGWRACAVAIMTGVGLTASLGALPQDSSLQAERLVNYVTGKILPLSAKVGPVNIHSVEFTDRGRGTSRGGLAGIVPRASVSETSTTIRGHFLVENPAADEWEVTFTLELLDKSGQLIDRAVKKSKWEGEAKPFDFDHPILQYVVPSIAQVRIKLEGRLD